jgi:hypothetical protein
VCLNRGNRAICPSRGRADLRQSYLAPFQVVILHVSNTNFLCCVVIAIVANAYVSLATSGLAIHFIRLRLLMASNYFAELLTETNNMTSQGLLIEGRCICCGTGGIIRSILHGAHFALGSVQINILHTPNEEHNSRKTLLLPNDLILFWYKEQECARNRTFVATQLVRTRTSH